MHSYRLCSPLPPPLGVTLPRSPPKTCLLSRSLASQFGAAAHQHSFKVNGCLAQLFACCRFTPAISSINQELQQLATTREDMHFLDCGNVFSYDGDTGEIHASLMPDGVNLNAAGMEQLATCLQPVIRVSVCPSPPPSGPIPSSSANLPQPIPLAHPHSDPLAARHQLPAASRSAKCTAAVPQ